MLLRHLQTFAAICEYGSLTAAAEHLHLSQPAVSRQLKALERELGTGLCVRRGHAVLPTPAGEAAYGCALRMSALARDLQEQVARAAAPGAGSLTIAAVDTLAVHTLPDLLLDFLGEHPAVQVRVHTVPTREAVAELLQHEADLALTTTPVTHPRLQCQALFDDPVALVASASFAASLGGPLRLEDLQDLPLIAYEPGTRLRALIDAVLEQHGVRPRVALEFDGQEAVREVLLRGLGLAFVPLSAARQDLAHGSLVRLTVHGLPPLARQASLLLARDLRPSSATLAFVRTAEQRFGRPPRRREP